MKRRMIKRRMTKRRMIKRRIIKIVLDVTDTFTGNCIVDITISINIDSVWPLLIMKRASELHSFLNLYLDTVTEIRKVLLQ